MLVSLLRFDAVAIFFVCCFELWTLWATRLRCPHVHSLSAAAPVVFEEAIELSAGRVEGTLLIFGRAVGDERSTFVIEGREHDLLRRPLSQPRALMQVRDDLAAEQPQVVAMLAQGFGDRSELSRWRKNGLKHSTICWPGSRSRSSYIQLPGHCSRSGQYAASASPDAPRAGKMDADVALALGFCPMRLITLLNHCQHFPGFVYEKARLCPDSRTIEIDVRPRRGSKPVCSGCHQRGRLRSTHPSPLRIRPVLGLHGAATLPHAAGRLQNLRRAG